MNERESIVEIGRPNLGVHDPRQAYTSLARRIGANLRLLQETIGHGSITATANIYADLYDELDDISALVAPYDFPANPA